MKRMNQWNGAWIGRLRAYWNNHRLKVKLSHVMTVFWQDIARCDLLKQASAMAYITLFSLVPSLAAVFTVISLFTPLLGGNSHLMQSVRNFILHNLAAGSGSQVVEYLQQFMSQLDLKRIGITSFAGIVITLILLLRQIEQALNRIWLVRQDRNVVTRFVYFWTFLTLGMFAGSIVIGLVSGYRIQELLDVSTVVGKRGLLPQYMSSLTTWGVWVGFFFLAYKIIPNCPVGRREAGIGALVAGTLLHSGSRFYGTYAGNFTNYKTIYGALAALPVFLLWIYICWVIILFGALIAWRIQQGFPESEKEDTVAHIQTPLDRIRNIRIQEMLPVVLLVVIYRNFASGNGLPLSMDEIQVKAKLPKDWLLDAIEALVQLGLIAEAKAVHGGVSETLGGESTGYVPTKPAELVDLGDFGGQLAEAAHEWLDHWQHDFEFDLSAAVKSVTQLMASGKGKRSLANCLG